MTDLQSDVDAAIGFLTRWAPACVLVAMNPDGRGIDTAGFDAADRARGFIVRHQTRGWNVYFQVNPDRRASADITSKAGKKHVAAVVALHADVDPYKGEEPEAGRQRVLRVLEGAEPGPPTVIILSGNGYNVLWRLREPAVLAGPADIEDVEARNRWLAQELGGDSVHDVCRVMRLPGTVNFPNAGKRARGLVPAMSRLVLMETGRRYDLQAFPVLAARQPGAAEGDFEIVDVDEGLVNSLPHWLREIVVALRGRPPADQSGSGWAFHAARLLIKCGWSPGQVAGLLLDPRYTDGVAGWLASKGPEVDVERQARRTAARAARAVAQWREEAREAFDDWHEVGEGVMRDEPMVGEGVIRDE